MLIVHFNSKNIPTADLVGSKGLSLIKLTKWGFPVPPGFVLTTRFFEPWMKKVQLSAEWERYIENSLGAKKPACDDLKAFCQTLILQNQQREILEEALQLLNQGHHMDLVAVRSSSPEEDQQGASFAGGYTTSLGVRRDQIEEALKQSFASCFDERVYRYKKSHHVAVDSPQMAVIVQQQLAPETAGVAFSINPITNYYDETVINGNYGLGETVVSGKVTPDTYIVDKVHGKILERTIGSKKTTLKLVPEGGVFQCRPKDPNSLCLSDHQVLEIGEMIKQIGTCYNHPVDIEWAFVDQKLFLLQARPITAYIPLPETLLTKPGERKRLYLDSTLISQGATTAFSVLGSDFFGVQANSLARTFVGTNKMIGLKYGFMEFVGGRLYANLSNVMKLPIRKKLLDSLALIDVLTTETIKNSDISEYIPKLPPRSIFFITVGVTLSALYYAKMGFFAVKAFLNPLSFHAFLRQRTEKLIAETKKRVQNEPSLEQVINITVDFYKQYLFAAIGAYLAGALAKFRIDRLVNKLSPELKKRMIHLEQHLPNNVTIEMGLDLFRLSQFEEIKQSNSDQAFSDKLQQKRFSEKLLSAWDEFMDRYGFRCPMELDIALPRFQETPKIVFQQLKALSTNSDETNNPLIAFEKGTEKRQEALGTLLKEIGKSSRRRKKIEKLYSVYTEFAAYREIPKYHMSLNMNLFRQRVLSLAKSLVEDGRLDYPDQVFDLKIVDLIKGQKDPSLDLKGLAAKNAEYYNRIKNIKNAPRLIDSRGKILRAPLKEMKDNEIIGTPISPGTVRGRVNILIKPDEKPVLPGDILVTRATEPGWTPLFLNAGGIILEVGGLLQHGALVAREYGKPCIAGIDDVTSIFKDGDTIEMDGANGVIRICD